jgi:hypothetical protein
VKLQSPTLARALEILDGMHVIVRADSTSPWIELDVNVRGYCLFHFGIWKHTDVMYAEDRRVLGLVAMGEDPVDVERLVDLVEAERKLG